MRTPAERSTPTKCATLCEDDSLGYQINNDSGLRLCLPSCLKVSGHRDRRSFDRTNQNSESAGVTPRRLYRDVHVTGGSGGSSGPRRDTSEYEASSSRRVAPRTPRHSANGVDHSCRSANQQQRTSVPAASGDDPTAERSRLRLVVLYSPSPSPARAGLF